MINTFFTFEYLAENHFGATVTVILAMLAFIAYFIITDKGTKKERVILYVLMLILMCILFSFLSTRDDLNDYCRYVIVDNEEPSHVSESPQWDAVINGNKIEIYER